VNACEIQFGVTSYATERNRNSLFLINNLGFHCRFLSLVFFFLSKTSFLQKSLYFYSRKFVIIFSIRAIQIPQPGHLRKGKIDWFRVSKFTVRINK
jgi:hypothetical protein